MIFFIFGIFLRIFKLNVLYNIMKRRIFCFVTHLCAMNVSWNNGLGNCLKGWKGVPLQHFEPKYLNRRTPRLADLWTRIVTLEIFFEMLSRAPDIWLQNILVITIHWRNFEKLLFFRYNSGLLSERNNSISL